MYIVFCVVVYVVNFYCLVVFVFFFCACVSVVNFLLCAVVDFAYVFNAVSNINWIKQSTMVFPKLY